MNIKEWLSTRSETLLALLLMALVAVLAYGVMIPGLGFYRDDWYMIWAAQARGPGGLIDLFSIDRPFIGYLYAFDYGLLGPSPLNWHLYALLVKLAAAFACYWLLRLLWPEERLPATGATLLFLVYPGFYQQPNAALFINLLLAHAAAIASLALSVHALRTDRPWAAVASTVLALGLALFYLVIYEAMIGLEAARLVLLAYALHERRAEGGWKPWLLAVFRRALPYLLVAAGFAVWRVFLFDSGRRSTDVSLLWQTFSAAPLHGLLTILIETAKDFFDTTVFAWTVPLYQNVTYSAYRDLGASLLLAALAVALTGLFFYRVGRRALPGEEPDGGGGSGAYGHMFALGALIVLVTVLPIVVAGRNVTYSFQWDRYSVQSSLGVAMLVTGLAYAYLRPPARGLLLLALLGSGVVTQFHAAVYYRELWAQERAFWWQLSWRVPDLQPGATLVAAPPPGYRFLEEYEVWGPLNLIYNPGGVRPRSGQVPYDGIELDLAEGVLQNRRMRGVLVVHDYSLPLVVSKPGLNACVHVIDGRRLELPYGEDPRIVAIAPYSQIELVLADAPEHIPPERVFGREPQHDWCYYYERIDLARQRGDWEQAGALAEEIERLGLAPADRSEWLPVIETYVNAGDLERARELARKIKADRDLRLRLCEQLEGTAEPPGGTDYPELVRVLCGGGE